MQDTLNKMNESQRELFVFPFLISNFKALIGKEVQREARTWLSPPDPWKNHHTARESHYDGTSTWFVQGNIFANWKASGQNSLLWIHGKRGCLTLARFHVG